MIKLSILGAAIAAYLIWCWLRRRRRQAAADRPFPDRWRAIVEGNMQLYRRLPEPLQRELHRHVNLFLQEFEQLQKHAGRGTRAVMDDYGATSPAEFFAVLAETFHEKPRQLRNEVSGVVRRNAGLFSRRSAGLAGKRID